MNIEMTKIQINIGTVISDMICLMAGKVIALEEYGKVNLVTSDGNLVKQLIIPCGALSVTLIDLDNIALSYHDERAIKIFNIEKETVFKVITLDKVCWGLSSFDKFLVVGLSNDKIRYKTWKEVHWSQ